MGGRKPYRKKVEKKAEPKKEKVEKLAVEEPQIEQQMVDPVSASIIMVVIKSVIGATVTFFTGLFWRWWVTDKKCSDGKCEK